MRYLSWRSWLVLFFLPLLVGCFGGATDSLRNGKVTLNVQGRYARQVLSSNGFGGTEVRPARYAYAEVLRSADNVLLDSTVLDGSGKGMVNVPSGERVYLLVWAQVEVPTLDGKSFILRGSVKPGSKKSTYASIDAFNSVYNYYQDSDDQVASQGGSLTAEAALNSNASGAFNIADQMVTLALGVERAAPGVMLPNLHAFWSAANPYTSHPEVAVDTQNYVLAQPSGRYVFHFNVRGNAKGTADEWADAYNDSALQAAMTRVLFADYSDLTAPKGQEYLSVFRRDNDNASISRGFSTESTAAFVAGATDFLSCAFRNRVDMYDVTDKGRVDPFYLDQHGQFPRSTQDGEFFRDSISVSLHGIWKNALGGGDTGLKTVWSVLRTSNALMAYNNAPLGCYPTFLVGLRNATSASWNTILAELAKEKIGDVTQGAYLNGTALWLATSVPVQVQGSLQTYNPNDPNYGHIYYDRDQAQSWRFTQSFTGTRTLVLTPTGGQDFFLELIGPRGVVAASLNPVGTGQGRSVTVNNLPPGDYVARVRAGYTTATGLASYRLSIQ